MVPGCIDGLAVIFHGRMTPFLATGVRERFEGECLILLRVAKSASLAKDVGVPDAT